MLGIMDRCDPGSLKRCGQRYRDYYICQLYEGKQVMKYGLIVNEGRNDASNVDLELNVGNFIQWISIENLYKYAGIRDSDIIRLSARDLASYRFFHLIYLGFLHFYF